MDTSSLPPRPTPRPPLCYGALRLPSRFLLSPLAGYTNLSFRLVVRELGGVGLGTTDLVNCRGLLAGNRKSLDLIESCPEDRPFAVQIFGRDASLMRDAASWLEEHAGVDTIDLNMGCPVDRIANHGGGAGMMREADRTISLVEGVVAAVGVPVSVKMRLGWDSTQLTAPRFAREFEQVGVAAVAVHGRTREQGFKGQVDRDGIRQVVEAVEAIPVIGNGDIRTIADAAAMIDETGCHGISIGRGALVNPWLFRQLAQWEATGRCDPAGNFEQRLALVKRQFADLERRRGIRRAIAVFRRTGHWHLKAMRVRADLRNQFQQAGTRAEIDSVLAEVARIGPCEGTRSGELPAMQIPVPSGPVERW